MIKKNWNSIILDGSIPQGELEGVMDNCIYDERGWWPVK